MKTCTVVAWSRVIRMVARKILEELNFKESRKPPTARRGAPGLPAEDARRHPARLEHADHERHRFSGRAAQVAGRGSARWCSAPQERPGNTSRSR